MRNEMLDVVGLGNAIVDVLAHAGENVVSQHNLAKGTMTLIDEGRAEYLYSIMAPATEVSGGATANTLAGLASLGGRGGFIGKIRNDQLGDIFKHDIRAAGVLFETPPATDGPSTGRCLIFVTPDAQRTMHTYLGASMELGPDDVDENLIRRAQLTYLEGYLWDGPNCKSALLRAARLADRAQRKVAFNLSDPHCVSRHRPEFLKFIQDYVDFLICNELEICSLLQVENFDQAVRMSSGLCEVMALTRSENGSIVTGADGILSIPAERVETLVDTTGAGDLYAAGFLYGYTHGRSLYDCGRIGAIAAAEVISHLGARPETSLAQLVADRLGP